MRNQKGYQERPPITMDGETRTLSAWAASYGIPYNAAYHRIWKLGWTAEIAIKTPLREERPVRERFFEKVSRGGATDCWEWKGA